MVKHRPNLTPTEVMNISLKFAETKLVVIKQIIHIQSKFYYTFLV